MIQDQKFLKQLEEFFTQAFSPSPRETDCNPNDFKTVIKAAGVGLGANEHIASIINEVWSKAHSAEGDESIRILDIACGRSPVLAAILRDHQECPFGTNGQKAKHKIEYLGIDCTNNNYWQPLLWFAKKANCCFELPEWLENRDLNRSETLDELKSKGLWNIIVLSDALHEISPQSWPSLLKTLHMLLKPNGIFLLVDLDWDYIRDSTWGEEELHVNFWEAGAIWLRRAQATRLLRDIGILEQEAERWSGLFGQSVAGYKW